MPSQSDAALMRRCIVLAEESLRRGEAPFGSLVARNGIIVAESGNGTVSHGDVSCHAEILAMRGAQATLQTNDLSPYSIFSNCEPCPMCAFAMRELKFRQVAFGAFSPRMGGFSRWRILQDNGLEAFRPVFSSPPEIIPGLLEEKARETFLRAGWSSSFFTTS